MPFRAEQPLISISGQTACMSFTGVEGVTVSVSIRTPDGAAGLSDELLEAMVEEKVAAALRSALSRIDRDAAAANLGLQQAGRDGEPPRPLARQALAGGSE